MFTARYEPIPYMKQITFRLLKVKDLASVLGLLTVVFVVGHLEVFRLTLQNNSIIIKLTERDESFEGNLIESQTEEGNFPTNISLICAWACCVLLFFGRKCYF